MAPRIGRIGDWDGSGNNSSGGSGRRVATLRDLGSGGGAGGGSGSSSDDEEKEGENWFTGGERSGLAVQNPNSRAAAEGRLEPGSLNDMIRKVINKALLAGAPRAEPAASSSRGPFSGGGHILGGDEVESAYVPDPNAPPSDAAPEEETAIRHLTFWRNGISIEDGPLIDFADPVATEIVQAVDEGQALPAIMNLRVGQPVEIRVARRSDEDYRPPPKRPGQAFEGSGVRLGAPTPAIITSSTPVASSSSTVIAPNSDDVPPPGLRTAAEAVQTRFEVDQSLPTTSVQIRLADGTRLPCRMNMTHTVGDLRNFINAARPENVTRAYTIGTTFPNRILEDDSETIEAAGLKNSVVVQRWV